jgi:hypothetical protein
VWSSEDRYPVPKHRKLPWPWAPLQGSPCHPGRSPARLRLPSWGLAPLQRHRPEGTLDPGFQPRHVPPSGFLTLLTVYSLRASRSQGPVPLMGFTLQSFSPPQSGTLFSATALLPFLTSHPSALRTRRSRCPATPGLCSLRRSVPSGSRSSRPADALLGFFAPLQSVSLRPSERFPAPFPLVLSTPDLREIGCPALQGLTGPLGRRYLAAPPTLLRFVTRTRPQLLLKAMWSCRLPDWK